MIEIHCHKRTAMCFEGQKLRCTICKDQELKVLFMYKTLLLNYLNLIYFLMQYHYSDSWLIGKSSKSMLQLSWRTIQRHSYFYNYRYNLKHLHSTRVYNGFLWFCIFASNTKIVVNKILMRIILLLTNRSVKSQNY